MTGRDAEVHAVSNWVSSDFDPEAVILTTSRFLVDKGRTNDCAQRTDSGVDRQVVESKGRVSWQGCGAQNRARRDQSTWDLHGIFYGVFVSLS